MIFDTDILIWVQRGNQKAARLIDRTEDRLLSIYSPLELLQNAKNKDQNRRINDFLTTFGFTILPLSENIGHRASIYVEEYTLSSTIRSGDAIIVATAVENNMILSSSNAKHFKAIKELQLKIFKP